jgi:phospholipase C
MRDQLPHPAIKHVVVLMLENRGFDHLMGWLYSPQETPEILPTPQESAKQKFLGLSCVDELGKKRLDNPSPSGEVLRPAKGARSPMMPSYNPGESFGHIMNQMWQQDMPATDWLQPLVAQTLLHELDPGGDTPPPMTGYVLDYNREVQHHNKNDKPLDDNTLSEILDTYTPEQVPVLSGLARFYAVSDEWFCSVPSQTNTNRAFSMAGTSRGMVNNSFYDPFYGIKFTQAPRLWGFMKASGGISNCDQLPQARTLFEVLQGENYSWKVYWQDWWPPSETGVKHQYVRTMFPQLADPGFDANFVQFNPSEPDNDFFSAARAGTLPAVSWIEPAWGGGGRWEELKRQVGNDMHPVSDTTLAEEFVMNIYNALSSNPDSWAQTLFIITFDENGGTYDHLPPPPADESGNDACDLQGQRYLDAGMDPKTRTQFGFDFRRFGVRVPTLLVSPCVGPQTIFRSGRRTPFDHTSIIASILDMAQIPREKWNLGQRVAAAPTFLDRLNRPLRAEALQSPNRALNAPSPRPRDTRKRLWTQVPYVLQYIGSRWPSSSGAPLFIGHPDEELEAWTLTTNSQLAHPFKFVPVGGGTDAALVMNMSTLFIVSCVLSNGYGLGVSHLRDDAFLTNNASSSGARWQIRLLGSRDPQEPVCMSDDFVLFSRLTPNFVQDLSRRITPDGFQRLMPKPGRTDRLTTRAGQWALWRAVPAA